MTEEIELLYKFWKAEEFEKKFNLLQNLKIKSDF